MTIASIFSELKRSLLQSAGTVVFGMEDGTVSIFGLIVGVGATTTNSRVKLSLAPTRAAAEAVSMMAGVYLDAETNGDETKANQPRLQGGQVSATVSVGELLSNCEAVLAGAVRSDSWRWCSRCKPLCGAAEPLGTDPDFPDFLAAAVATLDSAFLPISQSRPASAARQRAKRPIAEGRRRDYHAQIYQPYAWSSHVTLIRTDEPF